MNETLSAFNPAAAWQAEPEHTGDLLRLNKILETSEGRFALILAGYNQPAYRDGLIANLPGLARSTILDANEFADFNAFEAWLETHGREAGPLHLIGLDRWLDVGGQNPAESARLQAFNRHRDWIAKLCRRPLLLWLLEHQLRDFSRQAPDAWEWRTAVLDFSIRIEPANLALPGRLDLGSAPREIRLQRVDELTDLLNTRGAELGSRERSALWSELGALCRDIGDWQRSLEAYQHAKSACDAMDDRSGSARAQAEIAYILWQRGEPDQAITRLAKAREVFAALGDMRSEAVTQGRIADILQARGQLDEALRIRRQEELPVYERLGDTRELLVGRTKLALLLVQMDAQAHGERIFELLFSALHDARRLNIPEAGQIEEILRQLGWEGDG